MKRKNKIKSTVNDLDITSITEKLWYKYSKNINITKFSKT